MNYQQLKSRIAAIIKQNNRGEITGNLLQAQLFGIIDSLGAGFQFVDVARTDTSPGTPDENVVYVAGPGTYPYFGGITVQNGNIGFFKWNGSWTASFVPVEATSLKEQMLTISSPGTATLSVTRVGNAPENKIEYSLDGETWETGTIPLYVQFTNNIYLRGNNEQYAIGRHHYTNIDILDAAGSSQKAFSVAGNIMSLIYGSNIYDISELPKPYAFTKLFMGSKVTRADGLDLPAKILTEGCYYFMFANCAQLTAGPAYEAYVLDRFCCQGMYRGCTSLATAPKLLAPGLAESCYNGMFYGCTSLASAPALPAKVMFPNCYNGMFTGCTSLTSAPALPGTDLANGCYKGMFENCSSLVSAPALPAKALAVECYYRMFAGCTGLVSAPELPANELATSCYAAMLSGCALLTVAPELPAKELAASCYASMFTGCISLTAAPILPARRLVKSCYANMFLRCSSLGNITCFAEDLSASDCLIDWLSNVSATGTFIKKAGVTWPRSVSGIPNNWTVVETGIVPVHDITGPVFVGIPSSMVNNHAAASPVQLPDRLAQELLKAQFVMTFDDPSQMHSAPDWQGRVARADIQGIAMHLEEEGIENIWGRAQYSSSGSTAVSFNVLVMKRFTGARYFIFRVTL